LCKSSRADKTATVIRKIFQIILWLTAGAYGVVGVLAITGALGSAYAVFGSMILIIGAMAAIATFLANKGSFDERGNKVRSGRVAECCSTAFALLERLQGREATRASLCTDIQTMK
jgi:hypothetical protein